MSKVCQWFKRKDNQFHNSTESVDEERVSPEEKRAKLEVHDGKDDDDEDEEWMTKINESLDEQGL